MNLLLSSLALQDWLILLFQIGGPHPVIERVAFFQVIIHFLSRKSSLFCRDITHDRSQRGIQDFAIPARWNTDTWQLFAAGSQYSHLLCCQRICLDGSRRKVGNGIHLTKENDGLLFLIRIAQLLRVNALSCRFIDFGLRQAVAVCIKFLVLGQFFHHFLIDCAVRQIIVHLLAICHLCIADTDIGQKLLSCRSNLTSRQTIIPCIGHHLLGRIFHQGLASSIINLPTHWASGNLGLAGLGQLIRIKVLIDHLHIAQTSNQG